MARCVLLSRVEELKKSDFDIVVFQEAFLPAAREIISNGLRSLYPFTYGPANSGGFTIKISSGIWVVSRIPLKILNTTQFKNCTGNDCFGAGAVVFLAIFIGLDLQL